MAKKIRRGLFGGLITLVLWVVGILISLAVGFGMVDGVLSIPLIPSIVIAVAGWILVLLTIIGAVLKIIDVVRG